MKLTTSSFRISNELLARLEGAVQRLNRGKDSIVAEALEEYLNRADREEFQKDARRQSMLASAVPSRDADVWIEYADTSDWK
jgi:predicted DNA-binding protein